MLVVLIARVKEYGQVGALTPQLVDGGVSILQYADDNIIFMEGDMEKGINMKLIIYIFEQLSGPNVNFYESEIFCFDIRPKKMRYGTRNWLVVRLAHSGFSIFKLY